MEKTGSRASRTSAGTIAADEEFAAWKSKEDSKASGRASRKSIASHSSQEQRFGHHHVSELQHYIQDKKDRFHRWLDGKEEKTDQETKLQEMATVIRTYRGLDYDVDTDEGKPWVDREPFLVVMSMLILFNSIVIGLEIDLAEGKIGLDRRVVWIVLEAVFCIVFLSEVVLKVEYNSWRWLLRDAWNLFAAIVACLMLLDLALGCFKVVWRLRLFSLFRVGSFVRLTRIIKRHHALDELLLAMQGLTSSMATIAWTALVMILIIYIGAMFLTFQIGHNTEVYDDYRKWSGGWNHEDFFGTIGRSMYTLFQMAALDQWCSQIARHVVTNQADMAVFFCLFLLLIAFCILNIVVSVICERMLAISAKTERQNRAKIERARKNELSQLKEIFEHADTNHTGEISLNNFLLCCKDPEVASAMQELQISVSDAARLFAVIDGPGSRTLSMKEFVDGCMELKGPAQSKALMALQAQADSFAGKIQLLEDNLDESERLMTLLDEITLRSSRRFMPAVEGTRRKMASAVGGTKPMVLPAWETPGSRITHEPLSLGNRPVLPQFPSLSRAGR